MRINAYRCPCERNYIDKEPYFILPLIELEGSLTGETSVTNPVFTIAMNIPQLEYIPNYCYVPDVGRYYFIDNIVSVANDLWEFHCSVDVLMSFKELIKKYKGFVDRNEVEYNPLIVDNNVPLKQGQVIKNTFVPNNVFSSTKDDNGQFTDYEYFGYFVLHGVHVYHKERS